MLIPHPKANNKCVKIDLGFGFALRLFDQGSFEVIVTFVQKIFYSKRNLYPKDVSQMFDGLFCVFFKL